MTCAGIDAVLAGPAPSECICPDDKWPDPTVAERCAGCDIRCVNLNCTGTAPYECTECRSDLYQWTTSDADDATILCLSEVPTGYGLSGNVLTRDSIFMASFEYWPRQDLRIEDDPVIIDGCVGAEPIPVHGRGLYLTGGSCLDLFNLNLGTEFTLSMWFNAKRFDNLFMVEAGN